MTRAATAGKMQRDDEDRAVLAPPEDVTVKVTPPYQVTHDGTTYGSGETATVPADVAELWLLAGWVTAAGK